MFGLQSRLFRTCRIHGLRSEVELVVAWLNGTRIPGSNWAPNYLLLSLISSFVYLPELLQSPPIEIDIINPKIACVTRNSTYTKFTFM